MVDGLVLRLQDPQVAHVEASRHPWSLPRPPQVRGRQHPEALPPTQLSSPVSRPSSGSLGSTGHHGSDTLPVSPVFNCQVNACSTCFPFT